MNAITPFEESSISPHLPFDRAAEAIHVWRGHVLHEITRVETAMTETLLVLAAVPERGATIGLPHLLGQRFDALRRGIATGGPFAAEGKHAAALLTTFREHEELRTSLCHGVVTVLLDRRGRWTALFRLVALRSGKASRTIQAITVDEADAMLEHLKETSQKLCAELGNVRAQARRSR